MFYAPNFNIEEADSLLKTF